METNQKTNQVIKSQPIEKKAAFSFNNSSARLVLVFIAGCAAGALIMSALGQSALPLGDDGVTTVTTTGSNNGSGAAGATATSSQSANSGSVASGVASGAVSVSDQSAGNTVLVDSVTVPPPGVWVAVQETNGSQLGNVLGAQRVHGPRSNVTVDLLRNTEPNHTYAIVLYRDGGTGTGFNLKTDSVYVDFDTGKRVVVPFHTTGTTTATSTNS